MFLAFLSSNVPARHLHVDDITMLTTQTAIAEEAYINQTAVASMEKRMATGPNTPTVWSAGKRADEEPQNPGTWYVEKRADEEPKNPGVWYVEKKG